MTVTSELADRLHLTASRIEQWKFDAARFNALLQERPGKLEPLVMLDVEETASAIYREIEEFEALLLDIDRKSHAAAGQIAEVGDALRLILLNITEISTAMYARETADIVDAA